MKKIGKFIKSNTKLLVGIILGAAVSGGAVYAATVLPSSQVGYDNSTSGLAATDVQGALDELYTKANHCKLDFRQEFLYDVNKPQSFSYMFRGSTNIPCLDLSNWDTSNVSDMTGMFYNASSLTSLDLSYWDTSNVRYMAYMFSAASSLTSLDLSSFDTSSVINMNSMFSGANPNLQVTINCNNTNLIDQINGDLGSGHYTCAN